MSGPAKAPGQHPRLIKTLLGCLALLLAGCLVAVASLASASARCASLQTQVAGLQQEVEALRRQTPAAEEEIRWYQTETVDLTFPVLRGEDSVDVHATVTAPQDAGAMPLVVLCHGFTGSRQGDGHFPALAQLLGERGVASIALDFPGNGESEEPFTDYTLDNMMTDLNAAIAYMQEHYAIDSARIGLVGHSMGGRLAALRLDEDIAAAALWSPAANTGLDGLEFLEHDPDLREELRSQAAGEGTLELPRWGVTVSTEFVEQMAESDPWAKIENYRGALLVAFAAGDVELLSQRTIDGTLEAAAARGQNFTNLYGQFTDATHNYTALSEDAGEDETVRARLDQATAEFFLEVFGL